MKINIAVWWVLDYETGLRETLGGLERWTRDIVLELVKIGYDVTIYQKSKFEFNGNYHGAKIIGIRCSKNFSGNYFFYKKFSNIVDVTIPTIFISQDLIWGSDFKNSMAINHGVWWSSRQSLVKKFLLEKFNSRYIKATKKTICVDTNYINWVIESVPGGYQLANKLVFIPNYFDENQFFFSPKDFFSTKINILFPRRIMGLNIHDEPRGGEDAILAIAGLIKIGFNIKLTMLGEGNLAPDLRSLVEKLGIEDNVIFETASFDKMHLYYKENDIVLVPSRFSEGTSLSAVEGLASGCFVIGSCVGGLQNLPLFPPFGDMVEPNPQALQSSIHRYIKNRSNYPVRNQASQDLVMQRFGMRNWKNKVLIELQSLM